MTTAVNQILHKLKPVKCSQKIIIGFSSINMYFIGSKCKNLKYFEIIEHPRLLMVDTRKVINLDI